VKGQSVVRGGRVDYVGLQEFHMREPQDHGSTCSMEGGRQSWRQEINQDQREKRKRRPTLKGT
jgi:hypothetical protein